MGYSATWKDILDEISDFHEGAAGQVWYRGISNSSHKLVAGLFRLNSSQASYEEYSKTEHQLYMYYKTLGRLHHQNAEGWELLYSMQHHGVKTRLLDWTESLSVALFFSTQNWAHGKSARLWMLDPSVLNQISLDRREIISPSSDFLPYPNGVQEPRRSFAVYPARNTTRILAQHGCFTVQGCLFPLEEEADGILVEHGALRYIDMDFTIRRDVLEYLATNGVTHFSIRPDLDGLAAHINETVIPAAWKA